MLKQALSVLTVVAAGAGLALGQDASSTGVPASRLPAQSYAAASGYDQPVTPPGRPSPYSNYQGTSATVDSAAAAVVSSPSAGCNSCGDCAAKCTLHGWFAADYELLFPSRSRIPGLVLDPAGVAGGANTPGTINGVRVNTGLLLCDGQIAMQGIALFSFRAYQNSTTPVGTIPLAIGPIPVTGFAFQSWHQIAGGEGNTLYRLIDDGATKLYAIGGTRYLNVEEDISTNYNIGGTNFFDDFHTRNQFVGLQFGAKLAHQMGRLELDGTAKLALGVNYTQLFILGSNSANAGIQAFTQRSNIGYYENSYFGMLPEVDVNARYRLTERLSVNLGYTFLMTINNWRAADQISTTFPPTFGPAIRSTYYLHGLTAGLTYKY